MLGRSASGDDSESDSPTRDGQVGFRNVAASNNDFCQTEKISCPSITSRIYSISVFGTQVAQSSPENITHGYILFNRQMAGKSTSQSPYLIDKGYSDPLARRRHPLYMTSCVNSMESSRAPT